MSTYITDLDVSLTETEETKLYNEGFTKLTVDLNKGTKGKPIYLWFKRGYEDPITRIQLTFNKEMGNGLMAAGYKKIEKNLNAGAGGDDIFLWFYKNTSVYDVPIVELNVTTKVEDDAQQWRDGWERLACDLNRHTGGNRIILWVKREKPTYICDLAVTDDFGSDNDQFTKGFIRVDEDTNRESGGPCVFTWYRQTTDPQQAFTDLQISISDQQFKSFQNQGYSKVVGNLNMETTGPAVYLWYNKEKDSQPIKAVSVIISQEAKEAFESVGVHVIDKNLNIGNKGFVEYVYFYQ